MALDFTFGTVVFTNQRLPAPGGGKTNSHFDGSIGAPIKISIPITLTGGTIGQTRWYFDPALFLAAGGVLSVPPNCYYAAEIPSGTTTGTFPMPIYTNGTPNEESQRNHTCELVVASGTTATIELSLRLTMDVGNYLASVAIPNEKRFKRSHVNAPVAWANTVQSIYLHRNRNAVLRLTIEDGAGVQVTKSQSENYYSRWYASAPPGFTSLPDPAEFAPGFSCKLYRGGVEVSNFSQLSPTEVKFRWLKDDADRLLASDALVYVIDETIAPNSGTYLDDYGTQGSEVITTGSVVDFGGNVFGPANAYAVENIDGDDYHVLSFFVGTGLDADRLYAVIAVINGAMVAAADDTFTNSFVRSRIPADAVGTPIEMDGAFDGAILDYNLEPYTDNVISTVVDNLKCRVVVDTGIYDTGVAGKEAEGLFFASDWVTDLKRIRVRIIDAATDEELWSSEYAKSGGSWSGPDGLIKPTYTRPVETDLGDGFIQYDVEFRNCFQNLQGLPDFAGKDIIHEWAFIVEYTPEDWVVEYRYRQQVHVEPFGAFEKVIDKIELFAYDTGLPLQTLCESDEVLVRVELDAGLVGTDDWNIRVYWQQEGGQGYAVDPFEKRDKRAPETESYVSPSGFTQLSDAFVSMLPPLFGSNVALFVFDTSTIPIGARVRLYVIAEPVQGPCDAYPCLPSDMADADVEVVTSDQQAAIEALPPSPGDLYLIVDHPDATPIPSPTGWQLHTGEVAIWDGAAWDYAPLPPGYIIEDTTPSDPGLKYWIVCEPAEDDGTYSSGMFCLPWLYPSRRDNGSMVGDGTGPGFFMFYSQYTGVRRNRVGLSRCRFGRWQVDSVLPGETWITLLTLSEYEAYAMNAATAVNINHRVVWFVDEAVCSPTTQGISVTRSFPP